MSDSIPDDIERFLYERIASLEGLEVVMLLRGSGVDAALLDEIAQRLSLRPSSIEPALAELAHNGLLTREGSGQGERWRYAPASPRWSTGSRSSTASTDWR
jgi:DNA-binding IclR family transcriptional regulator